jgi:NTE family protein
MSPPIGLVLGGGGLVGQAFHAGALAAIEHDTGWDPRTAEVIVGTSAGSVTGALLRAGLGADDLAGCFLEATWSPAAALGISLPTLVPLRWQDALRPQVPRPELVARCIRLPWLRSPLPSLMAMMPEGCGDVADHLGFLDEVAGGGWQDDRLFVTATRQRDGKRVVFGASDELRPPVRVAVAASCAVPSYFRPVTYEGVQYLDGGLHSATNADLLLDEELELIIVVSPLSADAPLSWSLDGIARRVASRRLRAEVHALERAGHDVIVVEPGREVLQAMGHDLMSAAACSPTVREAFLGMGRATTGLIAAIERIVGPRATVA